MFSVKKFFYIIFSIICFGCKSIDNDNEKKVEFINKWFLESSYENDICDDAKPIIFFETFKHFQENLLELQQIFLTLGKIANANFDQKNFSILTKNNELINDHLNNMNNIADDCKKFLLQFKGSHYDNDVFFFSFINSTFKKININLNDSECLKSFLKICKNFNESNLKIYYADSKNDIYDNDDLIFNKIFQLIRVGNDMAIKLQKNSFIDENEEINNLNHLNNCASICGTYSTYIEKTVDDDLITNNDKKNIEKNNTMDLNSNNIFNKKNIVFFSLFLISTTYYFLYFYDI